MIKLEVLKGIVGDKKSIKLGGSEWEAIVKLVDNDYSPELGHYGRQVGSNPT
jgi:hypothetical protein